MEIQETQLIKITPSEGKWLTNGHVIAEYEVYLGVGDSPNNWWETLSPPSPLIQEGSELEEDYSLENNSDFYFESPSEN